MVWPAARANTSNLLTLQEVTLGPALKKPPRSSQSLHCGPLSGGVVEGVGGEFPEGLGAGVVARTSWRAVRKRPVPASSSTTLPKITGSGHRCCVLIMWGSTTKHDIP
jgi:hypothetical protein